MLSVAAADPLSESDGFVWTVNRLCHFVFSPYWRFSCNSSLSDLLILRHHCWSGLLIGCCWLFKGCLMEASVRMRKPLRRSLSYTAGSRFIKSFNQGKFILPSRPTCRMTYKLQCRLWQYLGGGTGFLFGIESKHCCLFSGYFVL